MCVVLGTLGTGFHGFGHREENTIGCITFLYTIFSSIKVAYPFIFLDMAISLSVSQSIMDEI
jgi:hypothetical protein